MISWEEEYVKLQQTLALAAENYRGTQHEGRPEAMKYWVDWLLSAADTATTLASKSGYFEMEL